MQYCTVAVDLHCMSHISMCRQKPLRTSEALSVPKRFAWFYTVGQFLGVFARTDDMEVRTMQESFTTDKTVKVALVDARSETAAALVAVAWLREKAEEARIG